MDFKKAFDRKRKPSKLATDAEGDDLEVAIYKTKVKMYVTAESNLIRNVEQVFGIIWGQCSSALQSKIKSLADYNDKSGDLDTLWLLKELKKATSGIDAKAEPRSTLVDSLYGMFRMRQRATESNDSYMERFKANASTVELAQGHNIFCCLKLIKKASADPTPE